MCARTIARQACCGHEHHPYLQPNPELAAVEAARGDAQAAASARLAAWGKDAPRDPEFRRAAACDPRQHATEQMSKKGCVRSSRVHWK